MTLRNFVVLDSIHGKFIVNRHCAFQAESLIKTGRTHIEGELHNIFAVIDTLPQGSVIIDGGANIGFFTVPVANRVRGRNHTILAFEPQLTLYRALCGSLALNDIDFCDVRHAGLGDQPGTAIIPPVDYGQPQDFGTVQIVKHGHGTPVDVVTIDSLQLSRLDFLKLDVEGYECAALAGSMSTIQQHRPYIWVEYFISGIEPIKAVLDSVPGYEFFKVDYQNMLCVPCEHLAKLQFDRVEKC